MDINNDQAAATHWASRLLSKDNWVVLDTETTGLDGEIEVCQIGVLAPDGQVLLDTLVKPAGRIPVDASAIHGITDQAVAGAPTFAEVYPRLVEATAGKLVIIYNAPYDWGVLDGECIRANLEPLECATDCAMRWYSQWHGVWVPRRRAYRWVRLSEAAEGTGIAGDHSAVGDCRATLAVLRKMASAVEVAVPHV